MAAEDGNIIRRYVYWGEDGEIIPNGATHITVAEGVTFVRANAFDQHPNIIELICHDKVGKIEIRAFRGCPRLRMVIMPNVKVIEEGAFCGCRALSHVECGMLEMIGQQAFCDCQSLESINLPSARIVECWAFCQCFALTNVKFGNKLESLGECTFGHCYSLRRITIPLKNGLFAQDDIFMACRNLYHVDLVEEELLRGTATALQMVEWKNDMNDKIDSISRILCGWEGQFGDDGMERFMHDGKEETQTIRRWIWSILQKIVHYKAEHHRVLSEAATAIQHQFALPHDILGNNVLPFLALPAHTFEGENHNEEEEAVNSFNGEGAS